MSRPINYPPAGAASESSKAPTASILPALTPAGGTASVQVQLPGCETISASWIIPYAMTPASAWTGSGYQDGRREIAQAISINGMLYTGITSAAIE